MNNICIGDNLKFFKKNISAINATYDVIYIDPPYNTGNVFSYNDRKSNEAWQTFMLDRLEFAKQSLKFSGCIFISIDDSELYNLKLLCDKIFEKNNFLGTFVTKQAQRSNAKHINTVHEYILAYARDKKQLANFQIKRIDVPEDKKIITSIIEQVKTSGKNKGLDPAQKTLNKLIKKYTSDGKNTWLRNYCCVDEHLRVFFAKDLSVPGAPNKLDLSKELGIVLEPLKTRKWSSRAKILSLASKDLLYWRNNRPYEKHFLEDAIDNAPSVLDFYSRQGTSDLVKLGLRDVFDTPKPVELIKYLIRIATHDNDSAKVLDFFAGSGTTGQAVKEINCEDQKNHSFTLVQLDEEISPGTKAYKECMNLGIRPTIDECMLYRIKSFYKQAGFKVDYEVVYID